MAKQADFSRKRLAACVIVDKTTFDPRGVLCTNCGYNLTGNASGRCPECFTPVLGPAPDVPVDPPPTGDGMETGG